jgi:diguanylate cyclase (GGDEF)-like protein
MPRTDLTVATARTVGTGLALVLPVAALVVLRQFPPLTLAPDGADGWLVALALGLVALCSAVAVVPLLGMLVIAGRWSAGAAGLSATALAAASAALALAAPTADTLPNSGLALALVVVASGLGFAAWGANRTLDDERSRWLGVILALVLAETALAAALLAPGTGLDAATTAVLAAAGVVAVGAAGAWLYRRNAMAVVASLTVAVAAGLLAWARPGTADALFGLAPLVLTPPVLVVALLDRRESRPQIGAAAAPRLISRALARPEPLSPVSAKQTDDAAERERLAREVRAALGELNDARKTIALQRAELERAADSDALTGVASRAAIMDRLREEVAVARRYPHPVSVVLVDVDGMGDINAQHGTAAGDEVLRELALRMRVRVREADAIGRVAGDSFVAILPHTDEKGATVFAEAIRDRATARPVSTGRGEVSVTVSIGVTTMRSRQELTADTLLARADEAVASARAGGGNFIAYDRLHGLARLEERRPPTTGDDKEGQHRQA